MIERKYSVFVSSTFRDLSEHRECVIKEINKAGHIPIAMELFNPDHRKNDAFIKDQIARCDVFAIVVGSNSGQPMVSGIPFTEFEYNIALKLKKNIIRFVCESSDLKQIEPNKLLLEFRNRILDDGAISGWFSMKTADSLATVFAGSLRSTVDQIDKENPTGWIRSEEYDSLNQLRHLSADISRSHLASTVIDRIDDNSVFLSRSNDDEDEKRDIARFFWRMAFAGLFQDSNLRNLFFESASSASYMASRLVNLINENPNYSTAIESDVRFGTNCMFTFLNWASQPISTRFPTEHTFIVPQSPFTNEYAAAYGPIQQTISISATSFSRNNFALRSDAERAVDEATQILERFLQGEKGLIFISLTGLNISSSKCPGGFVNSYKNCLFKRAQLKTSSAKVFIIDGKKWDLVLDEESQYPVFADDLNWDKMLIEEPVCFVFSTKLDAKLKDIRAYFRGLGFHKPLAQKFADNNIVIVFNERFKVISKII